MYTRESIEGNAAADSLNQMPIDSDANIPDEQQMRP